LIRSATKKLSQGKEEGPWHSNWAVPTASRWYCILGEKLSREKRPMKREENIVRKKTALVEAGEDLSTQRVLALRGRRRLCGETGRGESACSPRKRQCIGEWPATLRPIFPKTVGEQSKVKGS